MTGPQVLVDRIVMHLEVSSVHASHISQVVERHSYYALHILPL